MIFRFQAIQIDDLRTYVAADAVAGDIVIISTTINTSFGKRLSGLYRLVDGFGSSGLTDDGHNVIESVVFIDHYWNKVTKNMIRGEYSGTTLVANGSYLTLTHSPDPDFKRLYGVVVFTPVQVLKTITPLTDPYSIENLGTTVTHPIYGGNPAAGFKLNKQYRMRKLAEMDVPADVLLDTGRIVTEIQNVIKVGDGFGFVVLVTGTTSKFIAIYNSTYNYLYIAERITSSVDISDIDTAGYSYKAEDVQAKIGKLDSGAKTFDLHQTLGGWGDYTFNWNLEGFGTSMISIAHYHDYPDQWTIYEPNPREFRKHTVSGGNFNDGSSIYYIGHLLREMSFVHTWYDQKTILVRQKAYNSDIMFYFTVSVNDGVALIMEFTPFNDTDERGTWIFNGTIGYLLDSPDRGDAIKVTFIDNANSVSYGSYEYTELIDTRNYHPTDIPKAFAYAGNDFYGDYWIHTDAGQRKAFVRIIDPDTGFIVEVADPRTMSWDDNWYGSNLSTFCNSVNTGGGTLVIAPWNSLELPRAWIIEDDPVSVFYSAGLILEIINDAVSVSSVVVSTTEPALTTVRVMIKERSSDVYYKWVSTAWVTEAVLTNGNTEAEFNAADHSLLIAQVGQSLDLLITLVSVDGTVTPVFHSVDVDYNKGEDSFRVIGPYTPSNTKHSIEAISATESRFHNTSGASEYMKCSVHLIED